MTPADIAMRRIGAVIHPATLLYGLNSLGPNVMFYDHLVPAAAHLIAQVDAERCAIQQSLTGASQVSETVLQININRYGQTMPPAVSFAEHFLANPAYRGIPAPKADNIQYHRYVQEDIAINLSLWRSIARALGIGTPMIDSIVNQAMEYWEDALSGKMMTLESFGLPAAATAEQIRRRFSGRG